MKMLRFRVTDEQYQELKTISSENGCRSANEFLKDIALTILSKDKKFNKEKSELDRDYLINKLQFHVTDEVHEKIRASAKKHGWTLSKEIRFRLNQTLSREPVMLENEIRELRKTRNEIVRIGQNIYYLIAQRQLLPVNDKNMWEDIKKLNVLIEDVKRKVNYLADARANILPVKRG
ncbi:hypothetical protein [Arsenophonus nasoniae]|nr:hypothetical protein [Arsenophonus nasoniae]